ncbi:GNAT family N-acetyltransferase [Phycicoccus ginsengisoli]
MGAAPVVREMRRSDAASLGAMHHRAWVDTYGAVLRPGYFEDWTVADAVATWERVLEGPVQSGVVRRVAVEAQEVVGFSAAGPARAVEARPAAVRRTELWGLYVARSWLGSGLGQTLLDAVLPATQAAELWVFEANTRARAFYRRNRFDPDGATFTDLRFPELVEVRLVR